MRTHPVIGVLAGCGGAGASTLAALLAGCAEPPSFLLDCDPLGGGIDVLLGCEQLPGPRWGQVRLLGGELDPTVLLTGLPRWHEVRFLAADTHRPPDPAAVGTMVEAAASVGYTVLDLPRAAGTAREVALGVCDLVLLVTPAEVRGVTASAMAVAGLDPHRTGLVVRGTSRNLPADHIGELLGLPVLARLPYDPAAVHPDGLRLQRIRRRSRAAVDELLVAARQRTARSSRSAA